MWKMIHLRLRDNRQMLGFYKSRKLILYFASCVNVALAVLYWKIRLGRSLFTKVRAPPTGAARTLGKSWRVIEHVYTSCDGR